MICLIQRKGEHCLKLNSGSRVLRSDVGALIGC